MVANAVHTRPPGRPRSFDPAVALDRAVELFWAHGYEGVDVERIAQAVGVTKPALYREFGDKPSLFVKSVQRYAEVNGGASLRAFEAETDIRKAVTAFCERSVKTATSEAGQKGCLMACAVLGGSERVKEIQDFFIKGLAATAEIIAQRFQREIDAKRLSAGIPAEVRGRLLIDLMQGLILRARARVPREQLLEQVRGYVPLILS